MDKDDEQFDIDLAITVRTLCEARKNMIAAGKYAAWCAGISCELTALLTEASPQDCENVLAKMGESAATLRVHPELWHKAPVAH